MKYWFIIFLICGVIVISIFGWTIGLLILIPAGILCSVIFSIIGGIGNFIDDRIDRHHDRMDYSESNSNVYKKKSKSNNYDENVEYVEYEYKDEEDK